MLTNVSYRRYKQKDFNNASFIIDILSFIVQNFNPIGLERKFELENDRVYVKMLWDICLSHAFTSNIYSKHHYDILSNPNLTFQKAYIIVKKYIAEDANNMNYLTTKVEENFKVIHFIYSSLYPKIYNRVNNFGIKNKSSFDFVFSNWKARKQTGAIGPKIENKLPAPTKQLLITDSLSKPKNPEEDKKREEIHKFEQRPIQQVPKTIQATKIQVLPLRTRGTDKEQMDVRASKRRAERRISLEKQLSKNTARMNIIKKLKIQ